MCPFQLWPQLLFQPHLQPLSSPPPFPLAKSWNSLNVLSFFSVILHIVFFYCSPHPLISYYSFFKIQSKWVFFFFWPRRTACGRLVPRPGIEPTPPAVEAWSPNHWTTREVPKWVLRCLPSPLWVSTSARSCSWLIISLITFLVVCGTIWHLAWVLPQVMAKVLVTHFSWVLWHWAQWLIRSSYLWNEE